MTELRTNPTKHSPNGMKMAEWDAKNKTIIIRIPKRHEDALFRLHDDGTYELTIMPITAA